MLKWNFLLIGITGDLAKRKILPALSQFASQNKDSIEITLIGYSRSKPDANEIEGILNSSNQNQKHNIHEIKYIQGEYTNPTFFVNLFNQIPKSEKLISYFAVPPTVFLDLLKTFCPYNAYNLEILIEKPFGQNIDEAKEIIKKVQDCKLEENVHFCDHYLFKEALDLGQRVIDLVDNYSSQKVKKIEIKAIEKLGLEGRTGYFDSVGTIKDMIPAHFYSLWHILRKYNIVQNSFNEIQIKNIDLGQYKGYKEEINLPNSKTETYFKINGKVDGIDIVFESGKNFGEKLTEITIVFGNGDSMKWNIDPRKTLNINDTLEIDLNRNNNLDHTNLLEDIKSNFTERFLKEEDALNGWLFYSKIYEFVKNNNIPLKIY